MLIPLPRVSVIVATRNRLPFLKRCVESIRAQTYPQESMELIIVDDGSTDETPNYLAALAAQESWVKVITQTRKWQASARNRGIALSSGELIAVTDDDCTVATDWLLSIASAMQDQDIAGIGGHIHAPGNNLIARYLDYVRALDPMLLPNGTPRYLVTANACYRRKALDQIDLFDETFGASGGEDNELTIRMKRSGMKVKFVPACQVFHWYEPDIRAFLRRYYRYGFGDRLIFDKHHAWEHWFPYADTRVRALISGNIKLRKFHEVEDTHLRPWYFILYALQHFSYLAGYLRLTDIAQVYELRHSEENNQQRSESDSEFVESVELRRKQSEAILRVLPTDLTLLEPDKGYREHELLAGLEQDFLSSPSTILKMLDFNHLLGMAVSKDLPDLSPSIVDNSLSETRRAAYKALDKHFHHAYTRQLKGLLRELLHQPDGITLARIEMLCYTKAIDVDRFLSWYGKYIDRINTQP